jgi:ParB-like chromosome segregation protein Spo0J
MPPVFVVRGPRGYLLVDGSHRTKAAAFNGELDIDAVVVRARSEADADAIADAFWAAEFTDGYYPSDQAGWGVAAHIRLEAPPQRRPGPQVAGRTAALERRRLLVSQSLGKAA